MSEQNVGKNLERILKEKRLTQDGLVKRTKEIGRAVSKRTISRMLKGDCASHRHDTVKDVADALGVPLERLLGVQIAEFVPGREEFNGLEREVPKELDPNFDEFWDTVSVPLRQVKSTRDLEIALEASGVRFERRWLDGEEAEDLVARVFQKILDGRREWWRSNLIQRREILKGILVDLTENQPGICPIDLYVGFTQLPVVDDRGNHLGKGKLAIVVADAFGPQDNAFVKQNAAINVDADIQERD